MPLAWRWPETPYFQTQLKPIGDRDLEGCSVLQWGDKGFILGGMYDGNGAHPKILIARTDSLGKVLWSKTYGGNNDEGLNRFNFENDGFLLPY